MSDLNPAPGVRVETFIGPNKEHHAITVRGYREVHLGAEMCPDCMKKIEKAKRKLL